MQTYTYCAMIRRFVFLGVLLTLLWGSLCGQTYILNAALNGQTITTCSGTFYDSGGQNGNYGNNQNYTVTFVSATPGMCLQVTFNSFNTESNYDELLVYDGVFGMIGEYSGSRNSFTITSYSGIMCFIFRSDGSLNRSGWSATISCVAPPPSSENMHFGVDTIYCPQTRNFYDPGGSSNYSNNLDVTQTFVSAIPGTCLQVTFSSFNTESNNDKLYIHDGSYFSGALLGTYSGLRNTFTVTSSTGALTFVFHSDGSVTRPGWSAVISCEDNCGELNCQQQSTANGSPCSQQTAAHPFCTDENPYGITYASGVNSPDVSSFMGNSSVNCLSTTPNPAWYYMQISDPGSMTIHIEQTGHHDVDFACWGPFYAASQADFLEKLCCGNLNVSDNSIVDCSYSSDYEEDCFIPFAQTGQWYLMLITNYSNAVATINFNTTSNSSATTNCSILAPFTYNNPLCEGDTLILTCTNPVIGATAYNWSGPNGWTATTTVPTVSIPNVTAANSGQYNLLPTGPGISASESHIDVTISALPNITVTANHDTVCSGTSVTLTANGAGAAASNYRWLNDNTTGRIRTHTPTTTSELGVICVPYEVVGTTNGCSASASCTIVVLPTLTASITPASVAVCKGDSTVLHASGGISYQWRQGSATATISEEDSIIVSPQSTTTYRVIATNEYGCTNSTSRSVTVRNVPNVSISGANRVCEGDSVQLTASPNGSTNSYSWSTGATSRVIWVHPTQATDYVVSVTNNYGCSSSATKHVDLFLSDTTRYSDTICWNESYQDVNFTINGPLTTGDHHYERSYNSSSSCDSVVMLTLIVLPKPFVVEHETSCGAYTWRGKTYMQTGVYKDTLTDINSCMQVDTLHLTVYHAEGGSSEKDTCSFYAWRGHVYTQSGVYMDTLSDVQGCMQVDTLRLTVYHAIPVRVEKDTCSFYSWQGITYNSTGVYPYPVVDEHGCDRTDTLVLTIYNPSPASMSAQSCDSYQWNGSTYYQSGVYTYGHADANACWQVDTLHLTITPPVHGSEVASACDSFVWHGTTYTQSGLQLYAHTDLNGCTQVDTLHLTVHHAVPNVERVIICAPNTYTWHGFTYNDIGTRIHTYNYEDQHGCACVDTLYLTITTEPELALNMIVNATCNQSNGEIKVGATGGTLPYRYVYLPDGREAYFEGLSAGHYHLQMIDSIGCFADAEFNIENIIHQVDMVNVTDAYCGRADGSAQVAASGGFGVFTYNWSSPAVSTSNTAEHLRAGNYSVQVVDSNGCSLSLNFRVNDIPGPNACFAFNTTNEKRVTFINCTPQNVVSWYWSFGDGQSSTEWQPTHTYDMTGNYPVVLTVEDGNQCVDSVMLMYVIREVPTCYLPSAFIPESDIAENRAFKPIGNSMSENNYEMLIFDRWGELVFVSRNPEFGWDGHIGRNQAPQGTYTYQIKYEDLDGLPHSVRGSVILLR